MSFKEQYIADNFGARLEFPYSKDPLRRISKMYNHSGRGCFNEGVSKKILKILQPILADTTQIPDEQAAFDTFARKKIKKLAAAVNPGGPMKIGIAQRVFNIFMKDLWAWNKLPNGKEKNLHVPLDNINIMLLHKNSWKTWTLETAETDYEFNKKYDAYMEMQNSFRSQLPLSNHKFRIKKPIELEQYLSHGFE